MAKDCRSYVRAAVNGDTATPRATLAGRKLMSTPHNRNGCPRINKRALSRAAESVVRAARASLFCGVLFGAGRRENQRH